jgi:S1-C subfamily serine protease
MNFLNDLSYAMVEAVKIAEVSTVLVNARRRIPASGISFSSELILTANHVVERDEDISVVLPNGNEITSTVSGRDPSTDLAVLRLSQSGAAVAQIYKDQPRVGQLALALGRPSLSGIEASLGIISAIGGPARTRRGGLLERYIRTDSTPYPGFSGGPLISTDGSLIGINTSGLTRGASITIPASLAWGVAETLAEHGRVRRGFLGVRSQPVNIPSKGQKALDRQQETGLLIITVEEGSPADNGGVLVGDILVSMDAEPVQDADEFLAKLTGAIAGQETQLQMLRGGKPFSLTLALGERE